MASILKVDELQGITAAGDITVTSEGGAATQSLQQGLAKVFAQINGTGTIITDISLNVASLTDDGVGEPWVNVTNSFNSANSYACTGATLPNTDWNDTVTWNVAGGSSQVRLFTGSDGTQIDLDPVGIAVFGDLA
jgi:hypothetical protein